MALVVNTNIASMNAQRSLAANTNDMRVAMERLSTGRKINSAADDAAGFAIAETMTAQVRGLNMAAKNASDALGLLKVIENATNDVTDMLQRVRELAVQAKSDTNGTTDVARLQEEANALFTEISRVSSQTMYNNKAYLGKDAVDPIKIQVGYNDGETITLTARNIAANNLGTVLKEDGTTQDAIAGEDGNRLHTLGAAAVTETTGTNTAHVVNSGSITLSGLDATTTFEYGGTTLTHDFAGTAPTDIAGLITALTTGSNASAYGTLGLTIADAGDGSMNVTWDAYGEQTDLTVITATGVSAWSTTVTGETTVTTETTAAVTESFLSIKSQNALKVISDAIDQVATYKADWGASQNRLGYTVSNLMNVVEFTSAARSRIQDADFAVEAANLAKAQVLQQTGTAMLAQANAAPQLALQLLK